MTGPFSGELAIFLHEAKKTVKLALITKGRRGLATYHVDVIGDAVPADAGDCQLEFPANQRRENENRFAYIEPRRAAGLVAPIRPPTSGLSPSSRVARPPAHPEAISYQLSVERARTWRGGVPSERQLGRAAVAGTMARNPPVAYCQATYCQAKPAICPGKICSRPG